MTKNHDRSQSSYEFDRHRFYPESRLLLQDGTKQLWLDPKPGALLHLLVRNSGKLITYEEMKQEVWPELQHVADRTLHQHKYALSAVLGKSSDGTDYIETISGKGYRFLMEIEKQGPESFQEGEATDPPADSIKVGSTTGAVVPDDLTRRGATQTSSSKVGSLFGGHISHVFVSCSLYSFLYAEALFIEIAYQYERFASSVWVIALAILFGVFLTSLTGLWADWRWTARGRNLGLLLSVPIFVVCALFLYVTIGYYLPNEPITEARFQTYPAHGAYLKSIYYFLPLAIIFLILPFHFVTSLCREIEGGNRLVENLLLGKRRAMVPKGSIYLKPWILGLLLFAATTYGLLATGHLFDNLKQNPYTSVFMQLVQLRLLVYFALGLECLLWFAWALNEVRRKVIMSRFRSSDHP